MTSLQPGDCPGMLQASTGARGREWQAGRTRANRTSWERWSVFSLCIRPSVIVYDVVVVMHKLRVQLTACGHANVLSNLVKTHQFRFITHSHEYLLQQPFVIVYTVCPNWSDVQIRDHCNWLFHVEKFSLSFLVQIFKHLFLQNRFTNFVDIRHICAWWIMWLKEYL